MRGRKRQRKKNAKKDGSWEMLQELQAFTGLSLDDCDLHPLPSRTPAASILGILGFDSLTGDNLRYNGVEIPMDGRREIE